MPKKILTTEECGYCECRRPRDGFRDLCGYRVCAVCYTKKFADPLHQLLDAEANVRPEEPPSREKLETFRTICTELSHRMFGFSDGDMDTTVEVKLVDRTREWMPYFQAIPYEHRAETMAEYARIFHVVQSNLHVATERFDQAYRMFDIFVLRPLMEAPVTYAAHDAARQVCSSCRDTGDEPKRQDDGTWLHWTTVPKTKPRPCPGTVFHEAQYQHEKATEAAKGKD